MSFGGLHRFHYVIYGFILKSKTKKKEIRLVFYFSYITSRDQMCPCNSVVTREKKSIFFIDYSIHFKL